MVAQKCANSEITPWKKLHSKLRLTKTDIALVFTFLKCTLVVLSYPLAFTLQSSIIERRLVQIGAERLFNLNWCLCGRCEVRKTARECVCCVEEPESENKLEGTLSTSIRIRRILALFFFLFFFFVIFAEYEILYNSCSCVWFSFFCEFYHRGDYVGRPLQNSHQCSGRNKHTSVLLLARTFCPGHCFAKFFLFNGKRWKEIPFSAVYLRPI